MTTPTSLQQSVVFPQQEWPVAGQNMQQSSSGMNHCTLPVAQGHQVVASPVQKKDPRLKNRSALFGFGIAEILIGGLSVLLTIIPLSINNREVRNYWIRYGYSYHFYPNNRFVYAAPGIWGGIFVITTGILAVRIKANHSRCMYIANMTMAIITACVAFSSTIISGFAAGFSKYSPPLIAIHVIITLLQIASWIIAIVHAAFCCRGVCFKKNPRIMQPVIYIPTQSNVIYPSQQHYVQGPTGQVMPLYVQQRPAQGYPHSSSLIQAANPPQLVIQSPTQVMQPPSYNNTDHMEGKSPEVPKDQY